MSAVDVDRINVFMAVRRAERPARRAAFSLALPLIGFLAMAFVAPILYLLVTAVGNPEVRDVLPRTLAALEGPHAGQHFELRDLPARIGRGAEVAIRLDADLGVSRRHAELYWQAGVLRLRDTNSAHGTTVNGYTITDKGLAPGDRIRVGHSLLQLQRAEPGGGGQA